MAIIQKHRTFDISLPRVCGKTKRDLVSAHSYLLLLLYLAYYTRTLAALRRTTFCRGNKVPINLGFAIPALLLNAKSNYCIGFL